MGKDGLLGKGTLTLTQSFLGIGLAFVFSFRRFTPKIETIEDYINLWSKLD